MPSHYLNWWIFLTTRHFSGLSGDHCVTCIKIMWLDSPGWSLWKLLWRGNHLTWNLKTSSWNSMVMWTKLINIFPLNWGIWGFSTWSNHKIILKWVCIRWQYIIVNKRPSIVKNMICNFWVTEKKLSNKYHLIHLTKNTKRGFVKTWHCYCCLEEIEKWIFHVNMVNTVAACITRAHFYKHGLTLIFNK